MSLMQRDTQASGPMCRITTRKDGIRLEIQSLPWKYRALIMFDRSCGSISFWKPRGLACEMDYWSEWYGTELGNRYCNDSPVEGKGGLDGRVIFIITKANGEHLDLEHQSPFWKDIFVRPARA